MHKTVALVLGALLAVVESQAAGVCLEAFLAGGPFFGSISYSRRIYSEIGESIPRSYLEEKGHGFGIALEAGVRFEARVGGDLSVFTETDDAYQTAGAFKGEGLLRSASGEETWEGEWGMKDDYLADYWGTTSLLRASNSWPTQDVPFWRRGFRLDLSGAQARVGIAIRL